MTPEEYNSEFFKLQHNESYNSAKEILPLVIDLFDPKSVLDVGCGSGAWLKAYAELRNTKNFTGIDGDYVKSESLIINKEHFLVKNLESAFDLQEQFDLVISLEVAEHLNEKYAKTFIESLVKHSDLILFSAAKPGQEGTMHLKVQYPEYWEGIFNSLGYICFDLLRDKIWDNENVSFWYKQNILIYVKESRVDHLPPSLQNYSNSLQKSLTRIHPDLWKYKNGKLEYYENIAKSLKRYISHRFLKRRLYR